MSEQHIRFAELESGDVVDQSHLTTCGRCRADHELHSFLMGWIQAAPRIEAPPFFESRVSQTARSSKAPMLLLFQDVARRWIPLFATLVIATGFLIFNLVDQSSNGGGSALLFDEGQSDEVSLEYVVNSLQELPEEGSGVDQPK